METPYVDLVPSRGRPGSRNAGLRVDGPEWEGLKAVTDYKRSDRSKLLLQFIDWYLYRPGCNLPERLPLPELARVLADAAQGAPAGTEAEQRRQEDLQQIAREVAARAETQAPGVGEPNRSGP
jgi:hypothetical protein